jgi:hypothetical protein
VHVEGIQPVGSDPGDLAGLAARGELAAERPGREADRTLLAYLAVVIGHDVVGVGVDPDHAGDLNVDAGLFLDLADHRVGHGFAHVHRPAGQRP